MLMTQSEPRLCLSCHSYPPGLGHCLGREAQGVVVADRYKDYTDISELPKHRQLEIRRFFMDYKMNENKEVKVDEILGAAEAKKAVTEAMVGPGQPSVTKQCCLPLYNHCCWQSLLQRCLAYHVWP